MASVCPECRSLFDLDLDLQPFINLDHMNLVIKITKSSNVGHYKYTYMYVILKQYDFFCASITILPLFCGFHNNLLK